MGSERTIFYPHALRELWPRPLAGHWSKAYPELFWEEDRVLVHSQCAFPRMRFYHFVEWFAAIHLFHTTTGIRVLIEKYIRKVRGERFARLTDVLKSDQVSFLQYELEGRPPDLFVYRPQTRKFWFVEVKGPGDGLSDRARRDHELIAKRLRTRVDVIWVREA
jgi:VRR-NUC domain-containing protein